MMFLYHEGPRFDDDPELLGCFTQISDVIAELKKECDNGHEICPDIIPSFDEYSAESFDKYTKTKHKYFVDDLSESNVKELADDEVLELIRYTNPDEDGWWTYYVKNSKWHA